jgi:hypothetical protein
VEAPKDPAGLVLEHAIRVELVLKHPLAGDDSSARWMRDDGPCSVGLQHIKLTFHGGMPMRILDSGADAAGNRQDVRDAVSVYLGLGLWMPARARVTMGWPAVLDVVTLGAAAGMTSGVGAITVEEGVGLGDDGGEPVGAVLLSGAICDGGGWGAACVNLAFLGM